MTTRTILFDSPFLLGFDHTRALIDRAARAAADSYPTLKSQLDITRLDHPRPRPPVIEAVGEAHQGCPILVLDGEFDWPDAETSAATGRRFLQDHAIAPYLAARYGIGRPHP